MSSFFFIIVDSPNINAEIEDSNDNVDDDEVRGFFNFNFIASTSSTDDFKFKSRN